MFNLAILQVDCPRERGKMGQETNDGNAVSLVGKTVAEAKKKNKFDLDVQYIANYLFY